MTDEQYLISLADHYSDSPVPEIRGHRDRLMAIASRLSAVAPPQVGAESYPLNGRWVSFRDQKPPFAAALDDPKVKTVSRVLVTNNIKARDRMGRMSHVWFSTPIQYGKEWVALDEAGRQIEFLTHWFDPFADATAAPDACAIVPPTCKYCLPVAPPYARPSANEYAPLPEPGWHHSGRPVVLAQGAYTADQMRAYADLHRGGGGDGWISVEEKFPPACDHLIVFGRKYGSKFPGKQVYATYMGTRPRETVEDEEITHYMHRPEPPAPPTAAGKVKP
ncbi:hypothetical protein AVMA1855_16755 [Acidovorax sp. SUPP1855]|uniref:DUF551 domain-containing protein n=1 Tax=Acidovorax sp. SUPP1855 TaxID=431774 RepID=UPI0023DE2468|nr:DUF551 domain-containing protein [Acidovorax sp. SUPP1855]GKS85825.1 hypothetical protein AVMA1855_16755 [Acidovorax sp. SUPP1855]